MTRIRIPPSPRSEPSALASLGPLGPRLPGRPGPTRLGPLRIHPRSLSSCYVCLCSQSPRALPPLALAPLLRVAPHRVPLAWHSGPRPGLSTWIGPSRLGPTRAALYSTRLPPRPGTARSRLTLTRPDRPGPVSAHCFTQMIPHYRIMDLCLSPSLVCAARIAG